MEDDSAIWHGLEHRMGEKLTQGRIVEPGKQGELTDNCPIGLGCFSHVVFERSVLVAVLARISSSPSEEVENTKTRTAAWRMGARAGILARNWEDTAMADDGALNRWRRYDAWDERPLRLDKFAPESPADGFCAAQSPNDPAPSICIENDTVVEMDGVAAGDFDMIDAFIAAHTIDAEVADEAMALDSVTNQCTRMAGPFLGVILEGYVGIIGVYFLGVVMHAIGFCLIFTLRLTPRPTRTDKVRMFSEIADGFRHIKTREILVATLAVTAIMNFFAMSFSSQIPAIAVEVLKLGTDESGYLAAAEGFGAFIGAMVIATRQFTTPGRLFLFGSILFELGILAFSHTPVLGFAVAILIIGGAGHSGFSASQSALMISRADPAMRSRAMGAIAVCIGTQPFGILLLAAVAESYGAPFAIAMNAVLGILLLIYAGWKWPVLLRRED